MNRFSAVMMTITLILAIPASLVAQDDTPAQASAPEPRVPPVNPQHAIDQLDAAYQKEYAFLEAQLRDLRTRSAEFEASSTRDQQQKEAQIDRVEGEWINLQSRSERLQSLLTEAEREVEAMDDARTTLEATFLQAEATLEQFDLEALQTREYETSPDGQKIDTLLNEAIGLLSRLGRVRESQGPYFLADGSEVMGRIIRIGNVVAYGYSDQGSGALAPAGEGRFKLWSKPAPESAEALANNRWLPSMGLFLFETESRAIEEQAGKTLLGVINSGGTIAWIIVALGLFGLALIILRFIFLRNASASTGRIVEDVGRLIRKGQIKEALDACKTISGSTARVVAAAVRNLDRERAHLEDIISESILHESSHLNRFGSIILVIAAVAPLLGLLGTVTGMITTFDIITEFGTGDPKLLSGGISIALVTTEIGLAVAIPTLLLGNVLSGWAESIKDGMEKGALRVINQYKEHRRTA